MGEVDLDGELGGDGPAAQHDGSRDEVVGVRARHGGREAHEQHGANHAATVALLALTALAACQHDTDATPNAFYSWDDRKVHCAIVLDTYARNSLASIEAGLDRAIANGEVIELYAHDPGRTVSWRELEDVLAAIQRRNLPYFTYAELAHKTVTPQAGVALSFDDAYVDHWLAGADLYERYGARLTFFVAYYDHLSVDDRAALRELVVRGHAVEAHSVDHLRAPLYVEQHGLTAYLRDEALPSVDWLRDDGFDVTTFAYPYGARTGEIDEALLDHVPLVRSVSFTWTGVADPCPN